MPLGNLTSQFFANIYLNELDIFVKHKLHSKYYIRYVDDFVIFDESTKTLSRRRSKIDKFLDEKLALQLHPDKSKIIALERGIEFLGMKIFTYHKLIKKRNLRKFNRKFRDLDLRYQDGLITYDPIYDFIEGWIAYVRQADTYKMRHKLLKSFEEKFCHEISSKEISRNRKNLHSHLLR